MPARRLAARSRRIYAAGIATRNATFETEVPEWEAGTRRTCADHRFVATGGDGIVGWAALTAYSDRCCYEGVADLSVYVDPAVQGRGVGRALLERLVASAEGAGIWTLQAGVFAENEASLALHRRCGFRVVGTRERIGQLDGVWRDVRPARAPFAVVSARAVRLRRLPLVARRPGLGTRAVPRRPHSGRGLPRRRARPLRAARGRRAPSAAGARRLRARSRRGRDRRRRLRRRVRLARRRRAALVAAAPLRPRRLRGDRPRRRGTARSRRRGAAPSRDRSSREPRTDDTIEPRRARGPPRRARRRRRAPARPLPRRAEPDRPRARPHPRRAERAVEREPLPELPDGELVAYCGSGVTACVVLHRLHLAGREGRLYPGSWSEWEQHPELPRETG